MSGYIRCKRCGTADVQYHRQRLNLEASGHLYVAHTPHGLKVGRPCRPDRRAVELRRQMFAGGHVTLLKVFDNLGHLEPFIHFELNQYRSTCYREVFNCTLETIEAAVDRMARVNE